MATTVKRADSNRTEQAHDKSIQRRISRHEKDLDKYFAERAFRRLMVEVNGR